MIWTLMALRYYLVMIHSSKDVNNESLYIIVLSDKKKYFLPHFLAIRPKIVGEGTEWNPREPKGALRKLIPN